MNFKNNLKLESYRIKGTDVVIVNVENIEEAMKFKGISKRELKRVRNYIPENFRCCEMTIKRKKNILSKIINFLAP